MLCSSYAAIICNYLSYTGYPPPPPTFRTLSSLKCKIPLKQLHFLSVSDLKTIRCGSVSRRKFLENILGWALNVPAALCHLGPHLRLLGHLVLLVKLWLPQLPDQQILQLLLLKYLFLITRCYQCYRIVQALCLWHLIWLLDFSARGSCTDLVFHKSNLY